MARASLLSMVRGPVLAVVLVVAAGCGGGAVDEASGGGAVAAEEGVPPGSDGAEDSDGGSTDDGSDDSGDSDEGSAGGPDVDAGAAGARPGAPFDIEAFENIGGPLDSFRDSVSSTCGGGACTVTEVITEVEGAPEGCSVDDPIVYDPPAQPEGAEPSDQFIQRGTSVTAYISCPPETAEGGESTTEEETTEEGTTDEDTTDDEVPVEEAG